MAFDKLTDSTALDNGLTIVANAIRTKGVTSAQLAFPQGMAEAVAAIPSGGGSVQEAEVTTASVTNTISFTFDVDTSKTTWWLVVVSHDADEFPDATPTTGSFRFACHGTVKGAVMSTASHMQTTRGYQASFKPTRSANGFTLLNNYAQFAGGATYKAYYCEVG